MLNKEKFAKEIVELAVANKFMGVLDGKLYDCSKINCTDCDFNSGTCAEEFKIWANSEYKEIEIDWAKVPVDTPVLVWANGDKVRSYFKNFGTDDQGPFYYVFDYGATSWSKESSTQWRNCELAREEDIKKYRKR